MAENLQELKARLFALLERQALKRGSFTLSSGKESNYYLDARLVTLSPEGAYLAAAVILEMVKGLKVDAVGGPTIGADPICGALAAVSHLQRLPLKSFIVRKQAKAHGTQQQIEGPRLNKGERVVLIDDVATTGKALLEAKEALDGLGEAVSSAIVLVDRNEGAKENLARAGIKLESIFTISDFGL